jgi:trigger factor
MAVSSSEARELEVEVETTPLEGGQVELSVRVPAEPVNKVREEALRAFSRRVSIPGFRRGKAPRAMVERHVDQQALKDQIIESLVGDAYGAALEKAGVKDLGQPRISEADITGEGVLSFKAVVTLQPEITLGEYKGLQATRHITPVTEEQVNSEVDRLRARQGRYAGLPEGAAIEKGDLAVVDYEMLVEGEKREEASAAGYPLEVGADQLFPELNEALVGARPGELRELDVTYPEAHSDKSLAGKTAHFRVTVAQVRRRQLPEADDEFARQVSDLADMAALRERIRQNLEVIGRAIADEDVRNQLLRQLSESASLDVPQTIVDRETDRRIDEITEELERRGLTLNQHLRQANQSFDDWRADLEADARQAARQALILNEIGEREKIEVTEEELHAEVHRLAEVEKTPEERVQERLRDAAELSRVMSRLRHRKILRFLVDQAQVTEEVAEPGAEGREGNGEAAATDSE